MSGTSIGARLAAKTNKRLYGDDFFRRIGGKGGRVKVPKGFAVSGKASEAGTRGGRISRRGKTRLAK